LSAGRGLPVAESAPPPNRDHRARLPGIGSCSAHASIGLRIDR